MARRISATPTSGSRPTRSRGSCASTATTSLFVTGMDEHGLKMQQTAARERHDAAGARRRDRGAVRGHGRDAERASPTTSSARPQERHKPRVAGDLASAWRRTATSICRNIPAGIRCATRPITTKASSTAARWRVSSRRAARRSNGSRRRAISSGSRPMPTGCSRITRRIPNSSRRRSTATRSSAS